VTVNTTTIASVDIVPQRLAAIAELTRLGAARGEGFDASLIQEADSLLRRSGERMRMSANHTVVALAGGTGSGKSSLFNALSGATFSPPGVTRPTTRHSHACVWGMEGAAPLLDWLGVQRRHRYARASALDQGEANLAGLLLLDLPDHDSVVAGSAAMVDRLVKMVDMLVWVLDPLKYADASVHQRYLVPLAGHAAVTTIVLNQCDTLPADQIADCAEDLRRLLDAEGLTETHILVTSAATGAGLGDLKAVLAESVAARRAASDRIAADIDVLLDRFALYAGDPLPVDPDPGDLLAAGQAEQPSADLGPARPPWETDIAHEDDGPQDALPQRAPWEEEGGGDWNPWAPPTDAEAPSSRPPWEDASLNGAAHQGPDPALFVPSGPAAALVAAFERAAGVSAVAEGLHGARERTALRYVGWPLARLGARLRGRAPARKPAEAPDAPRAQRSDIDNAVTGFADDIGGSLPEPWSRTVRAAARSRVAQAQGALGMAVAQSLPARDKVTGWWRLIAIAQWLLMLLVVAGVAWIGVILAFGEFHAAHKPTSSLISEISLIPWLAVMVIALLLLGSLTASWCQNMVVLAADREREQAIRAIRARVAGVTHDVVLAPAGAELGDYARYRAQLAAARAQ
jgi:GTP-binding protein EngB required for normal cell division